jgi:hypothetical protein
VSLPLYGMGGNVTLDELNEAITKLPQPPGGIGPTFTPLSDSDIDGMALTRMRQAHDDAQAMGRRETTWGGTLGTIAGTLVAGVSDPVTLATLPLGGVGTLGVGLRALEFAAIGGGTQATISAASASDRERAVPGSSKEIPGEIESAALFGGALGGAFGLLGKFLGAGRKTLPTTIRDDVNAGGSEAQLAAVNPFPTAAGEGAARDAHLDAVNAMLRGEPVRSGETFDVGHVADYAAAAKAETPEALAQTADDHLRPLTATEVPDVERFDAMPSAADDTASYWERRIDAATPEERRTLGVNDNLPDLPEGAARAASDGTHGPVLTGLTDRPDEAIAWLREARTGQVEGAVVHPAIGPIDFVYGQARGDGGGGYGLAKIAEEHGGFLDNLGDRLRGMQVSNEGGKAWRAGKEIVLSDGKGRAIIKTEWDGEKTRLLFNGYNFGDERRPARGTTRSPAPDGSAPQSRTRPSLKANIPDQGSVGNVSARDLTPEQMTQLAADKQTDEAVLRNLDRIRVDNPDMEFTTQIRQDDGTYAFATRKLEDVLDEIDATEALGKELMTCATGLEAAE